MRRLAILAVALVACGGSGSGSTPTAPYVPPPLPANISISNATLQTTGTTDVVTLTVANSGGTGNFYLEFWGLPILPTCVTNGPSNPGGTCPYDGMQKLGDAQTVSVTAGYSQSLSYSVPSSDVAAVKAFTQPQDSAAYSETGCVTVRPYGVCP
ncbi:MAG TPA: hypothetical protein VII66_00305 [Gemmatimonadaceae bacterium]